MRPLEKNDVRHLFRINCFGQKPSIDCITRDLNPQSEGSVSIDEVVATLCRYGIRAQAVRYDVAARPFRLRPCILYITSGSGSSPGHFLFAAPLGSGNCTVLDGRHGFTVNVDEFPDGQRLAMWDGTAIIETSRAEALFAMAADSPASTIFLLIPDYS